MSKDIPSWFYGWLKVWSGRCWRSFERKWSLCGVWFLSDWVPVKYTILVWVWLSSKIFYFGKKIIKKIILIKTVYCAVSTRGWFIFRQKNRVPGKAAPLYPKRRGRPCSPGKGAHTGPGTFLERFAVENGNRSGGRGSGRPRRMSLKNTLFRRNDGCVAFEMG